MLVRTLYTPLLALILALTLLAGAYPAQAAEPIDGVVAVVNDDVILRSELQAEVQRIEARLIGQGQQLPPNDVLRRQVLERMVMIRLQLQEAERRGVTVSDAEVDRAMRSLAQQNGMSLDRFRRALAAQGISAEYVRDSVRERLIIDRLRTQEVRSQVSVSDRDVDLFLENQAMREDRNQAYHLKHILVAVPDDAGPAAVGQAREEAERLTEQLRSGADFTQLAISHSDGQQALNGGDLGWIDSGALPSIFRDTVPSLDVGDVADPIRSPSGFHIVKLAEVRGDAADRVTVTHARHILLRPGPERGEEETRRLIESLYRQIRSGTPLAELAREYSDDPGSAPDGGDLGWQPAGTFVPGFENRLASLNPGQVSAPFQTRYGWHIVKLLGRREQAVTDEMRRSQARQVIGERRAREHFERWLRRLRDEAYVEYRIDRGPELGDTGGGRPSA